MTLLAPIEAVLARRSRRSAQDMDVFDDDGQPLRGEVGELVCTRAWPGMTRGIWGDAERYLETYWRRFPGVWTHGDWASVDEDGYWFLHGRSDDTLNIAGKRIGPAELESAAVDASRGRRGRGDRRPARGEGRGRVALLRRSTPGAEDDARRRSRRAVAAELGKAFAPERVVFVSALPKTRSAKIVRRAVRATALGAGSRRPLDAREPRGPGGDRACRLTGSTESRSSPEAGAGSAPSIARELADAGMRGRRHRRARAEQVEAVAAEIGGLALDRRRLEAPTTSSAGSSDRARARADRPARRERGHRAPGGATWERAGRGLVAASSR